MQKTVIRINQIIRLVFRIPYTLHRTLKLWLNCERGNLIYRDPIPVLLSNTDMQENPELIQPEILESILHQNNTKVLDGSWYLPNQARDPRQEYDQEHIPGARFFDIDAISDTRSDLPHMMPDAVKFSSCAEQLGLSNDDYIIVYDGMGLFSAARVWWLFRAFGHQNIKILDGGLPAWKKYGYPVTRQIPNFVSGKFDLTLNGKMISTMDDIRGNCTTQSSVVLDARSRERFNGKAPEPRPELSSGHMPGATSLPFSDLMTGNRLKPIDELKDIIDHLLNSDGGNKNKPIITSCGSGVTAAIITLALSSCGYGMQKLYDGSWTEWASSPDNPIE